MSDEIKRIDLKEFWELGFIQEINRRLLHPCGLALEMIFDIDEDGNYTNAKFGGVWDYRDDPEAMGFGDGVLSAEKYESVEKLFHSRETTRKKIYGSNIQEIQIPEEK